jgi:PIN domain nuclease of toxin-antitoxin system
MPSVVADTHAVVWYEEASARLSAAALAAMQSAPASGGLIYVSSITMVEIAYLVEKGRLSGDMFDRILQLLQQPGGDLAEVVFDVAMAQTMWRIPSSIISDMPDRMIAATALHLNLPLVTADTRIQAAPLVTIW